MMSYKQYDFNIISAHTLSQLTLWSFVCADLFLWIKKKKAPKNRDFLGADDGILNKAQVRFLTIKNKSTTLVSSGHAFIFGAGSRT